jgi:hypothetical protein
MKRGGGEEVNNEFTNFVTSQKLGQRRRSKLGDQGCDNVPLGQGYHTPERNWHNVFLQDEELYNLESNRYRRMCLGFNAAKAEDVMEFLISILHVLQNAVSATVVGRTQCLILLIRKPAIGHDIIVCSCHPCNSFPSNPF